MMERGLMSLLIPLCHSEAFTCFSACTCYNVSMGMVSENITPPRENLLEVKG